MSKEECHITAKDRNKVEILDAALRRKFQDTARRAIPQLNSDYVPDAKRRILAIRWELPLDYLVRPPGMADALRSCLESVLVKNDKPIEVLICNDWHDELNTICT